MDADACSDEDEVIASAEAEALEEIEGPEGTRKRHLRMAFADFHKAELEALQGKRRLLNGEQHFLRVRAYIQRSSLEKKRREQREMESQLRKYEEAIAAKKQECDAMEANIKATETAQQRVVVTCREIEKRHELLEAQNLDKVECLFAEPVE